MRKLTDKVLGLIAPVLVAEAAPCACDGVWKSTQPNVCGCVLSGGIRWQRMRVIRCDGCRLIYDGPCFTTSTFCYQP